MDDRLERLRRRVHLSDRVLEDIGAALSDPARSLDDILLEMGFDSRDVERLMTDAPEELRIEPAVEDQTIIDDAVPRTSAVSTRRERAGEPTVDELIGRLLDVSGRFEVQGEIARGAMGRILAAWDLHLGRPVALKVLRKSAARDLDRVRFLEEAQVTGQLQHPNIVPVYELGRLDDQIVFVMRRIEGRSLKDIIAALRRGDPTTVEAFGRMRLLTVFHQLCLAVAFAHTRGVVHRDLKPSNVMVGDFGEVALLDWGLCKVVSDATRSTRSTSDRWRTVHGQIIGTPAYMAPEQAMGLIDQIDSTTDVYGLGAILYHMLTLRPPFIGKTNREIVQRVLGEPLVTLRLRAPEQNIPAELDAICQRCMARDPAARFANARELALAIETWLARPDLQPVPDVSELVSQGVAAIARQQSLLEDIALVRDTALTARARCAADGPPEQKQDLWEAESRLRALEIEVADASARATSLLMRACAKDADNSEARVMLCEQFHLRQERAIERNDEAAAAFHRRMLADFDDGQYQAVLAGDGALQVETLPRGARVQLWRCFDKNRRLVPSTPRDLGLSPIRQDGLPNGIYRLTAHHEGYEPLVASVLITAGQCSRLRFNLMPSGTITKGFVHIPVGTFRFGTQTGMFVPMIEQALPDYLISIYPVTCGDYLEFLRHVAVLEPADLAAYVPRSADGRRLAWRAGRDLQLELPGHDSEFGPVDPDEAITCITHEAALAYCEFVSQRDGLSYRLPTEEEWEKAARGPEGRVYPWGHRWEPTYAVTAETWPSGRPPKVGLASTDCSPYGVADLAGGVREWTSTFAGDGPERVIVRGGSFLCASLGSRPLWVRDVALAGRTAADLGFRLARDAT